MCFALSSCSLCLSYFFAPFSFLSISFPVLWSLNANKSAEQQASVFPSGPPSSSLTTVGLGRGFSISVSFKPAAYILLQNLWSMLMRTRWLPGTMTGNWQGSFVGLSSAAGSPIVPPSMWTSKGCMACYLLCTPWNKARIGDTRLFSMQMWLLSILFSLLEWISLYLSFKVWPFFFS